MDFNEDLSGDVHGSRSGGNEPNEPQPPGTAESDGLEPSAEEGPALAIKMKPSKE